MPQWNSEKANIFTKDYCCRDRQSRVGQQSKQYRDSVLPPAIKNRLGIEAGATQGWSEWVGDNGRMIGIDKFGESAPDKDLFKHYGITVENVVKTAQKMLKKK